MRNRDSAATAAGAVSRQQVRRESEMPHHPLFNVYDIGCHVLKTDVPNHDKVTLQIEIKRGWASEVAQCLDIGQPGFVP